MAIIRFRFDYSRTQIRYIIILRSCTNMKTDVILFNNQNFMVGKNKKFLLSLLINLILRLNLKITETIQKYSRNIFPTVRFIGSFGK